MLELDSFFSGWDSFAVICAFIGIGAAVFLVITYIFFFKSFKDQLVKIVPFICMALYLVTIISYFLSVYPELTTEAQIETCHNASLVLAVADNTLGFVISAVSIYNALVVVIYYFLKLRKYEELIMKIWFIAACVILVIPIATTLCLSLSDGVKPSYTNVEYGCRYNKGRPRDKEFAAFNMAFTAGWDIPPAVIGIVSMIVIVVFLVLSNKRMKKLEKNDGLTNVSVVSMPGESNEMERNKRKQIIRIVVMNLIITALAVTCMAVSITSFSISGDRNQTSDFKGGMKMYHLSMVHYPLEIIADTVYSIVVSWPIFSEWIRYYAKREDDNIFDKNTVYLN